MARAEITCASCHKPAEPRTAVPACGSVWLCRNCYERPRGGGLGSITVPLSAGMLAFVTGGLAVAYAYAYVRRALAGSYEYGEAIGMALETLAVGLLGGAILAVVCGYGAAVSRRRAPKLRTCPVYVTTDRADAEDIKQRLEESSIGAVVRDGDEPPSYAVWTVNEENDRLALELVEAWQRAQLGGTVS